MRVGQQRGTDSVVISEAAGEAEAPGRAIPGERAFEPAKQVLWSRPGYLVRRLNQIHYALFFEECRTQNVTPVQYGILTALSLTPWLDQTALGNELGLDRTTTADVVKRLEERGLVARRVNPLDRRSRQAVITSVGLQTMGRLQDGMMRAQQRLLAPLSPPQQKTFMKLLSTLVEANNKYSRASLKTL
jgi:DNA-binding MarR family transcriptional regulator